VPALALLVVWLVGTACSSTDDGAASAPGTGRTQQDSAAVCTTPESPTTIAYDEVPGVDPDLLSVDVYERPGGCDPAPVVFWVHGGGWRIGDKTNPGTDTKAAWAAANGWTLVSVNYRLSTDGAGVVWPTHGRDVATAIAAVLDRADELGIDPGRVAVAGHSAGAHIASMIAVDPSLLDGVGLDRTDVDCLAALDTEGYDLNERMNTGGDAPDALIESAFGTGPAVLAAASPTIVLTETGGPVADAVIVTRGLPRRVAQAERFAEVLRASGSVAEMVEATGYSHAEVNAALGRPGETVETPTVTAFLQGCLA
jgi:acetyl esterase/lipase